MSSADKLSYENGRPITIEAPWGQLAAQCWGNEDGQGVLFVHGRQHNSACFSSLIPLLPQQHFLYVCLDLPGHGLSSPISRGVPLDFLHYVYSIKFFVDQLQWKRFIFVGHSLGGMMGTVFCSVFPELVDRLVLLDSATPFGVPASRSVAKTRKRMDDFLELERRLESNPQRTRHSREVALDKIMNGPNGKVTAEVGLRILERCTTVDQSTGLYTFSDDPRLKLELTPNLTRRQVNNILSGLACPTILILATESLRMFENKIQIVRVGSIHYRPIESKHVELVVVDGDHFVHINNPQSVAPLVAQFITKPHVKSSL